MKDRLPLRRAARPLIPLLLAISASGLACAEAGAAPGTPGAGKKSFEQLVLDEMSRVRRDPRAYASVLRRYRAYYRGKLLEIPGRTALRTVEGARAVDEAIRALSAAKPAPALSLDPAMSRAARDHVADIGPRGAFGHEGRDGSDPFSRLERYGRFEKTAGENIQYGARDPEEVIAMLVVDDGVRGRGHRKNILDRGYRVAGVACGKHSALRTVCVMNFAGGFVAGARRR
jgi:uncharacterized protein YkwD